MLLMFLLSQTTILLHEKVVVVKARQRCTFRQNICNQQSCCVVAILFREIISYRVHYFRVHLLSLSRSVQRQTLLAKPLLTLFSRDIALLDIADLSRRRAFVQVLYELAQRVLVTLCFTSDLPVLSVAVSAVYIRYM